MDIVHHAFIGGAGFIASLSYEAPLVGAAFVAGSVFPDLDVFFMLFGKRFYLRNHQGVTHSIFLAPLYALLICGLFMLVPEIAWSWSMYFGALAGLLLHVTLDWFNTFRIALLSPVIKNRYSLDAVFFIDSVALALTALFYLLYFYFDSTLLLVLYPVLFAAYFAGKLQMRRIVGMKLQPLYAIPSSLNPFEFYILEKNGNARTGYLYNFITGKKSAQREYPAIQDKHQKLAEQSTVFNDMTLITRAFYITEVIEDSNGTTIKAGDIAVRNFGGRFGQTVLRFDINGNLLHEMANI